MHLSIAFFFPCILFLLAIKFMSLAIPLIFIALTPFIAGCIFIELNSFFHLKSELKHEGKLSILQTIDHKIDARAKAFIYFETGIKLIIILCLFLFFSFVVGFIFFGLPGYIFIEILMDGNRVEILLIILPATFIALFHLILLPFMLDMVFRTIDF